MNVWKNFVLKYLNTLGKYVKTATIIYSWRNGAE